MSRQTFYQVFNDKLDCFMAAFDQAAEFLLQGLLGVIGAGEEGDLDDVRAIGPPVIEHVRTLWNTGAFGEPV